MSPNPFLTRKHPDTHIDLSIALEQLWIFLQGTENLCLSSLDKRIPQIWYSVYVNSAIQYNLIKWSLGVHYNIGQTEQVVIFKIIQFSVIVLLY